MKRGMGEHPTFMDKTALILKRDGLGRVRTPVEKRRMAVEEFKRSGLSAAKPLSVITVPPLSLTWVAALRIFGERPELLIATSASPGFAICFSSRANAFS